MLFLIINIFICVVAIILNYFIIRKILIYDKLSNKYNMLFNVIKILEELIKKDQFIRHEYKNQLAAIYTMTQDKNIKNLIEDTIIKSGELNNDITSTLMDIPNGGLKGLLYYRIIEIRNNNIELKVNINTRFKSLLSELTRREIISLSIIVDILLNNAQKSIKNRKEKIIFLEIYELKNRINIVISNRCSNISKLNISNKDLIFIKNILKHNKRIKEKHEIIDGYNIETIIINCCVK